ncbi:MAG: general secretion pathway protein GspB [Thermodesulfobacteriota bacterium]
MSSILDSLKKLEKETAQQDLPLTHTGAAGRGAIPKYVIGIIGAICICIGAIGLAAYYKGGARNSTEPLLKDATHAAKPAAPLDEQRKVPVPSQDTPAPLPSEPLSRSTAAPAAGWKAKTDGNKSSVKPVPAEDKSSKPQGTTGSEQVAEVKESPAREKVEDKAVTETTPQTITTEENSSDLPDAISEKTITQEKKPVPIDRLEGVGLKIQAISWSDVPEQSLAVINNQVMREGGAIEGYQISRINPDDIILQRGGKSYRLDFRSTGAP